MSRAWMNGLVLLLAALSAGCGEDSASGSGGGNGGDGTTASAGGNGGGTTSSAGTTTVATTTAFTTTSSSTTTTTGPVGECDPPAPAGSLYALSDIDLKDDVISMCKYRGDVLLIVNVAQA